MSNRLISILTIIIGVAMLLGAVLSWFDNLTTTEPTGLAKWIFDIFVALLGAGAGIKGWLDLRKKDESSSTRNVALDGGQIAGEGGRNIQVNDSGRYIEQHIEHYHNYEALKTEGVLRPLHQLPPAPADFTGREQQVKDVLADFENHTGAAISGLTGMGGIGKTALGLVVAHQLAPKYPDAQVFLDLKGTTVPRSTNDIMRYVILSIEPETDLQQLDDRSVAAKYQSVLHDRRVLLFFDNARSNDQVAPLRPPNQCAMLVTSRWTFSVPGLKIYRLDVLDKKDATDFLLTLNPQLGEKAAELAKACAYLPLALRIAGSFLQVNNDWVIETYLAQISDRKKRLHTLQTAYEQSELKSEPDIVATFELSYQQFNKDDRRRWSMLAIFRAPFTADGAAFIWETDQELTQRLLSLFRRYGILEFDATTGRYSMHDLLIDFAEAKAEDIGNQRIQYLQIGEQYYYRIAPLLPQIHQLSNGHLTTIVSHNGGGYLEWKNVILTRFGTDPGFDNYGIWIYVRDLQSSSMWSATRQPISNVAAEAYQVVYHMNKAVYKRRQNEITTHMEIVIPPRQDVELRLLTLSNHSKFSRQLQLSSYAELPRNSQAMHDEDYLLFRITDSVNGVYLAHFVVLNVKLAKIIGSETDRARFLGNGTARAPDAVLNPQEFSHSTKETVDPIFSLQTQLTLSPNETAQVAFITLVAASREEAVKLARRYRRWKDVLNAFKRAADAPVAVHERTSDEQFGSLQRQLDKQVHLPSFVPISTENSDVDADSPPQRPAGLLFDNGLGGFSPDRREYIIYLEKGQWTPGAWTNVLANPQFGFLVSESGMGCTWAINSSENRLTAWHNDPVSNPPSEAIYLRDDDTGQIWSPTPLPARTNAPYLIRHGMGYTIFENNSHYLNQNLTMFTVPDAPVKIAQLGLKNASSRIRRINVTYYAEWVLGTTHENSAQHIMSEFASNNFSLLASNPHNQNFSQRVAFLTSTREINGLTTDRSEFLGIPGSYVQPAALKRVGLSPRLEDVSDPCAVIQLLLWLLPGEAKEVTFLLGQGADRADALNLINRYQDLPKIQTAWEALNHFWDERIGDTQTTTTSDQAVDLLMNRWLLYESLSCSMLSKPEQAEIYHRQAEVLKSAFE